MNNDYRSLTIDEIEMLERRGCTADDWSSINVAEDFNPNYVSDVAFHGDIFLGVFDKHIEVEEGFSRHTGIHHATLCDTTIGDNCLIENIGCHILRYTIGEECHIANIGTMATTEGATFGQCGDVAVMNEAGDANVFIFDGLTSQMAALMVECSSDKAATHAIKRMVANYAESQRPEQGTVGYRVKIVNTNEIVNTVVGDDCEINGAARISECTIISTPEAATFIGSGVTMDNTIVQPGGSVTDGAKLAECFVGEACHVGRGFSAESSVFFANSYMDNGEACAAFCGPFSVSHHKATLLIGGRYSFYNAGSATNFSNHAYKLGPVHYGTLERGSKTASGAHILWPATIGAFSVCLGKIQSHPDTHRLPFSYVIGQPDGTTRVVPGRNITTVGTFRDTAKWPRRDIRPRSGRRSLVNFDWLNPMVADEIVRGRQLLDELVKEQGENAETYTANGYTIRGSSLRKGMELYDMALMLFLGQAIKGHDMELPDSTIGTGQWTDLAGMLAPTTEVDAIIEDIRSGAIEDIRQVEDRLTAIHQHYDTYKWSWTYKLITSHLGIDTLTEAERADIEEAYGKALEQWKEAIRKDAEREFALGDVSQEALDDFLKAIAQ